MKRLYVIVRKDLPVGAKAAQAIHAVREFIEQYPQTDREWYRQSNTVVVLAAESEEHLQKLRDDASRKGIQLAAFQEPDMSDALTALTLEPTDESRRFCRGLPLLS